jgi:hypothetical protein
VDDPYPGWGPVGGATLPPAAQPPDAYPEPDPDATAALLPTALITALTEKDHDALERMIRRDFATVYYPTGGSDVHELYPARPVLSRLPSNGASIVFDAVPATVPPITDTLRGIVDPEYRLRNMVYSRGWGAHGNAESVFVLMEDDEGDVFLAGQLYAEEGFDDAGSSDASPTRTVELTTYKGRVSILIDVPSDWHKTSEMRVASYPAWEYEVQGWNPSISQPGLTKVEAFGPSSLEPKTLEAAVAWIEYFDEPQLDQVVQHLELPGGQQAVLATTKFESVIATNLFVEAPGGIVAVSCGREPEPCDAILRSVRVR